MALKKFNCFIFIIIILFSSINIFNIYASDIEDIKTVLYKHRIIENLKDRQQLTGLECVECIIRLVGADKESKNRGNAINFSSPYFSDLYEDATTGEDYLNIGLTDADTGYLRCAYKLRVARGFELDSQKEPYFFPFRTVTLKECLTFMFRCLNKDQSVPEDIIDGAMKNGLLFDNDDFLNGEKLSYDDFCLLLYRMLYHKKVNYVNSTQCFEFLHDNKNETYIEYLDRVAEEKHQKLLYDLREKIGDLEQLKKIRGENIDKLKQYLGI